MGQKFVPLSLIILSLNFLRPQADAAQLVRSSFPDEGVYSGMISMNTGEKVPLDITLSYTEEEVPAASDEILSFKKKIMGGFVLAGEGGPYSLASATYDLEDGLLDLQYMRSSGITGSSSVALRFLGHLKQDGSISGDVISGLRGNIGTFSLAKNSHTNKLLAKDINVGKYVGSWISAAGNKSNPFELYLESSSFSKTNPSDLELEFTPGRIGSGTLGTENDLNLPFSEVIIDYLRNTIKMTYVNAATGASLTLLGKIKGDTIEGTANSSFLGETAHFVARRVP